MMSAGCGGSSSETPPPLEPAPEAPAAGSPAPAKHHVVQQGGPADTAGPPQAGTEKGAPAATWGTGGAPGR
jgi:hypothetical protein